MNGADTGANRASGRGHRRRGQPGPRAVTLTDVAEEAGVSVSTASRVLNGSDGSIPVRAAKQEAVRRAADRLGYRTNVFAQAMAKGKTTVLGVALTDPMDLAEWRAVSRGVDAYARSQGLGVISSWTDGTSLGEQVRVMLSQGVQTLVVSCSQDITADTDAVNALRDFHDAGRGVCVLGCPVPGFSTVEDGSAAAAVRLASIAFIQGSRSPLVLGGGPGSPGRAVRARAAFVSTWREFGGVVDEDAGAHVSAQVDARDAVADLRGRHDRPDVVFAVDPSLLDGATSGASDLGDSVALAGIRFADQVVPMPAQAIAVAVLDRVAAARQAAELAFVTPAAGVANAVEPLRVEIGPAGGLRRAASL